MMEYMTKIAKDMYGISQKDSWNPADIWLVSDYNKVVAFLEKKLTISSPKKPLLPVIKIFLFIN